MPTLSPVTLLLTITALVLGCTKATVNPRNGGFGGTGSGSGGDAAGLIVVPFDARPGETGQGPEDLACRRSVNLQGVTITRPVPFDVVIVADNSDSLSWSRDNLSAGLKNLLARVHGHEARFFMLTTTQYGASSKDAVSPFTGKELVSWHDPISGTAYLNPVTTYRRDCSDGNGTPITCPKAPPEGTQSWKVKGTWEFSMPAAISTITPDMDDDVISEQQNRIANAILGLGGGGSPQEQTLCTLLRYIGQAATDLPKHAVFVVLTDEDDTSPSEVCLASYEATRQAGMANQKMACESDCPEYLYLTSRPNQKESLDFTCLPVDDKGTVHPEQAVRKSVVSKAITVCAADAGASPATCNDADITMAGVECGAGAAVKDCTRTCTGSQSIAQCSLTRTDNKTDLCTQAFEQNGIRYANLIDYCQRPNGGTGWGPCSVMGLKPAPADGGTTFGQSEHTSTLVTARDTWGMIQTFKSSADRLIGKGNYSIETIVLDPRFTCPVHSGQSYASYLRALASSENDVFSLCDDYAPAIERIATFADYLVQTIFTLDLDDYEAVDAVVVTNKQGQQRTVAATDYRYDRPANLLRFNPGVLTAQDDSLAVSVARECYRIIQ